MTNRIGVDLGGTKIDVIVLAPDDRVIFEERVDTPKTYEGIVATIADLVKDAGEGIVGIGAPGSSGADGLWRNANIISCNGRPFAADLQNATGREIRTENDANCFALSEAIDGAGKGFRSVAFFTIGTGLGGGIVMDGKLVRGAHGEAGEFGHMSLPWMTEEDWPPTPCFCGKAGCVEMYVSGTGLKQDYARVNGVSLDGPTIVALARQGDAKAIAALKRMQLRFARVIGNIINCIDPDIFVIGGGLSALPEFVEEMPPLVATYSFSGKARPLIRRAMYGDQSGVRGAARLWTLRGPATHGTSG